MNAVVYHNIPGKMVNGTLFYSFEYYAFLRQYVPVTYYIVDVDADRLNEIKRVFCEKYTVADEVIDGIRTITRTEFAKLRHRSIVMLDTQTVSHMVGFTFNAEQVLVYSNQEHNWLGKPKHIFYGWYNYQPRDVDARLKFFRDIHRTYPTRGDKVFVSHLNGDSAYIASVLNLPPEKVLMKTLNAHNNNLFERIEKIIYYHTGSVDTNNRIMVESYIHNIPIEVVLNGHTSDSIAERTAVLSEGGLDQFLMTVDDPIIQQVLK